MSDQPGHGSFKRALGRLGILVLAGLSLLITAAQFTAGLKEGDLVRLAGGFLGIAVGGGLLAALILAPVQLKTSAAVSALAGLLIAVALAVALGIATRVDAGAVCNGQRVATAAAYQGGPGPHPVEAIHNGRRIWTAPSADWRPASTEETELIACVGPLDRVIIETCDYIGGPTVTRYGYERTVTLVAARTGAVLAGRTFSGEPPRQCGQTEERSVRSLRGEKRVDLDAVWDWLGAWVVPVPAQASVPEPAGPTPVIIVTEPVAQPVQEINPLTAEAPEQVEPADEIGPEATGIEVMGLQDLPSVMVTPGSQPPETAVLRARPVVWSGPDYQGEMIGNLFDRGETVEILGSIKGWVLVRRVSPAGDEVLGWIQPGFLGKP